MSSARAKARGDLDIDQHAEDRVFDALRRAGVWFCQEVETDCQQFSDTEYKVPVFGALYLCTKHARKAGYCPVCLVVTAACTCDDLEVAA